MIDKSKRNYLKTLEIYFVFSLDKNCDNPTTEVVLD